jgi:hypothetical protein
MGALYHYNRYRRVPHFEWGFRRAILHYGLYVGSESDLRSYPNRLKFIHVTILCQYNTLHGAKEITVILCTFVQS